MSLKFPVQKLSWSCLNLETILEVFGLYTAVMKDKIKFWCYIYVLKTYLIYSGMRNVVVVHVAENHCSITIKHLKPRQLV